MVSAADMKKKSEEGAYNSIMDKIEKYAEAGRTWIDLADHDDLYLSESVSDRLEKEKYKVNGTQISWG